MLQSASNQLRAPANLLAEIDDSAFKNVICIITNFFKFNLYDSLTFRQVSLSSLSIFTYDDNKRPDLGQKSK